MTDSASSRRDFLQKAAAAAAGASVLSIARTNELIAEALGRPVPVAPASAPIGPDDPVRIGVIGTGGMGTGHVDAFLGLAKQGKTNVQVAALADVCQARLEVAKKKVEEAQGAGTVETFYADYPGLLRKQDIHGVLIASPEHWHAKMAEDAVTAGKDVYLEKPMTLRLADALRLLRVQRANPNVIVNIGTQFVMISSYREAQKIIAAGGIGKPVWSQTGYSRNSKEGEWLYYTIDPEWQPGVNLDWKQWCGPLGSAPWDPQVYARWRRYRKYSTGIIGDLLVHRITPLVMAINPGWPTRVTAAGGHYVDKVMENHDQENIAIEFENEHTMIVAGSTANEVGLETVIRGHRGNLYVGGRNLVLRPERIFADEVDEQTIEGEDHGDDQDELRLHWLAAIRGRLPSPSPVELAAKVMVVVDLATRSLWEGAAFGFDPKTMRARKL